MKFLILITLATTLCGCGLTGGAATHAMAPRLGSPTHDDAPGLQSPGRRSAPDHLFRVSVVGETPLAATTSSAAPTSQPDAYLGDERVDDRLARASAPWVEMGGALQAEEDAATASSEASWKYKIRPYGWLPRISGSATIKGNKNKFVITQGTLVSNLKAAGLIRWEAQKDDMIISVDTIGFTLADDAGIDGAKDGSVKLRVELMLIELDAGVRVIDTGKHAVDAYVGGRYIYVYARVNPKNVGIQGQSRSVDWVDPIIGSRYTVQMPDKWEAVFQADYGGFGIGSASDKTYQMMALAEREATERLSFGFGYRYLVFDHSQGSGANKGAEYFRFSGPIAGLSYRF